MAKIFWTSVVRCDLSQMQEAHLVGEAVRKISDQERYEIYAEAFRIMTDMHAPGKDEPPSGPTHSYEDRYDAYTKWLSEHGSAVWAGVRAAATVLCDGEDE